MAMQSSTRLPSDPDSSQAASSVDRVPYSTSLVFSISGGTATLDAWNDAIKIYTKELSKKELEQIMVPAGPEDVFDEIERWQRKQQLCKYDRVAKGIRASIDRIQRFSASIDMIVQGAKAPGCLLWGSIKFVLIVSDDSTTSAFCELSEAGKPMSTRQFPNS